MRDHLTKFNTGDFAWDATISLPAKEETKSHANQKQALPNSEDEHFLTGMQVETLLVLLHHVVAEPRQEVQSNRVDNGVAVYFVPILHQAFDWGDVGPDDVAIVDNDGNQTVLYFAMDLVLLLHNQDEHQVYAKECVFSVATDAILNSSHVEHHRALHNQK